MKVLQLGIHPEGEAVENVISGVRSKKDDLKLQKYWRIQREEMLRGIRGALKDEPEGKRLCIIGAGNATDLDLPALLNSGVAQVDFLDLTSDPTRKALQRAQDKKHPWKGEAGLIEMDATLMMGDLLGRMGQLPENPLFKEMPIQRPDDFLPLIGGLRLAIQEAMMGVRVPEEVRGAYDAVVSDCLLSQLMVSIETKIDETLMRIFQQRPDNRLMGPPSGTEFLDFTRGEVAKHLIANQMQVMRGFLASEGRIFFASDHTTLIHHPDGSIMEHPRIRGDFMEMVQVASGMRLLNRRDWEWNRHPHELHRGKNYPYETEKVTGLLLAQ